MISTSEGTHLQAQTRKGRLTLEPALDILFRVTVLSRRARKYGCVLILLNSICPSMGPRQRARILSKRRRFEQLGKVEDVVAGPGFRRQCEFELERGDDRTQKLLQITKRIPRAEKGSATKEISRAKKKRGGRKNPTRGRTFESTIEFSGHATRTKHSTSIKLANFAGLSLPTATV